MPRKKASKVPHSPRITMLLGGTSVLLTALAVYNMFIIYRLSDALEWLLSRPIVLGR